MAEEQRTPIQVEGLALGDEGQLHHFNALASREEAAAAAKDLESGDAAFIKRSDLKWTYAILAEKDTDSEGVILRFEVDMDKNRKSFPQKQWGKYIRVISKQEQAADEPASAVEATSKTSLLSKISFTKSSSTSSKQAEPEVVKAEETPAETAVEEVKEEVTKPTEDDDTTKVSTLSDSLEVVEKPEENPAATTSGWFAGIFGSTAASQQSHPT
eukprot:scaffold18608_cov158-Skeletonema_marinoi.AAC.1